MTKADLVNNPGNHQANLEQSLLKPLLGADISMIGTIGVGSLAYLIADKVQIH
jgi:HSP90 family molecular chaperone